MLCQSNPNPGRYAYASLLQGELPLRMVIALSAAATLLYTPVLKRLTGVKNATVAAVITASPLAGALAAKAVRNCNIATGVVLTRRHFHRESPD